jgi:hypothetical protein
MAEDQPQAAAVLRAALLRIGGIAAAAAGLWITAAQPFGPESRFVALPLMLLALGLVLGPRLKARRHKGRQR